MISPSASWKTPQVILGAEEIDNGYDRLNMGEDVEPSPRFEWAELKRSSEQTSISSSNSKNSDMVGKHFQRLRFCGLESQPSDDEKDICQSLTSALALRKKWIFVSKEKESREAEPVEPSAFDKPVLLNAEAVNFPPKSSWKMKRVDGVYTVWQEDPKNGAEINMKKFPNFWLFCQDVNWIIKLISHGPAKTFCYKRLRLLQTRFHLHNMLNDGLERWETRNCLHRDFYNVRRVDNHVHHSACMTRKHLLRFIKSRLKGCPNVVVQEKGGKLITLTEFYNELNIKPHELSVDNLDIHSVKTYVHDVFQKSDEVTQLRTLFLKTDNYMKGRFLAELTAEVFEDFDQAKYNNAEFQLTISGKSASEWDKLASWVCRNNLQANHVKWSIQIPRVYSIFRLGNLVQNFEEMLDNIFRPLFEVTVDPSSHPDLHLFLQLVVSFDSVYDESLPERKLKNYPMPRDWDSTENPPYFVYSYYLYSNLFVLNSLREELGMNTFLWRPHSGESGDFGHLAVSFMIADSIQHGIILKQTPVLQYL